MVAIAGCWADMSNMTDSLFAVLKIIYMLMA